MEPEWNQNGTKMEPQLNLTKPNTTPLPPPSDVENVENRPHGLRSTYVRGCRCEACRAANAEYYHVLRARTEPARIPIEEARWRIRRLIMLGLSVNEVSRVTGLAPSTVDGIRNDHPNSHGVKRKYVNRSTIEALDRALAEKRRSLADGIHVDAARTRAIVGLLAEKLGKKEACRVLGWDVVKFNNFWYGGHGNVKLGTARHVTERADAIRRGIRDGMKPQTWEQRTAALRAKGYVVNPYIDE